MPFSLRIVPATISPPGATTAESPGFIHSSVPGYKVSLSGKSAGISLFVRATQLQITQQRPSRAICCIVPNHSSPLSYVVRHIFRHPVNRAHTWLMVYSFPNTTVSPLCLLKYLPHSGQSHRQNPIPSAQGLTALTCDDDLECFHLCRLLRLYCKELPCLTLHLVRLRHKQWLCCYF